MKEIKIGYTNLKKYRDGKYFVKEKTFNSFNHRLNYELLREFDFVPKLIENTSKKIVWEFVEGKMLTNPSNSDLKEVARMMRTIHKSSIQLPKNNMRQRIKEYIRKGHLLKRHWPEIEDNWKVMNKLITKMQTINPLHNDIWWQNLIKDKSGKIWLVDWEYATMGDKHFDLNHFIESYPLNLEQTQTFLNAYNSHDNYQAYIPEWMPIWSNFSNWIVLCWAYPQEEEPFPLAKIKEKIKKIKF